jgi:hypothetical protein
MGNLASAKDVQGGIGGAVGKEAALFEDMLVFLERQNDCVDGLREEVRSWREAAYLWDMREAALPGTPATRSVVGTMRTDCAGLQSGAERQKLTKATTSLKSFETLEFLSPPNSKSAIPN